MHRTDNSCFLLYIEPKKEEKSETPVDDEITMVMQVALSEAAHGTSNYYETDERPVFNKGSGYKGYHCTDCDTKSASCDYLLQNGMITNSLCVFYLRYYRNAIPESEMKKVFDVVNYYRWKYPDNLDLVAANAAKEAKMDFKTRIREYFEVTLLCHAFGILGYH